MGPGLIGLEVKERGSIDGRHEEHAQAQHEDLKKCYGDHSWMFMESLWRG